MSGISKFHLSPDVVVCYWKHRIVSEKMVKKNGTGYYSTQSMLRGLYQLNIQVWVMKIIFTKIFCMLHGESGEN
mgnify:CR=1 FL=1|jgi:hypothetical protein